ncbi:unnamed protein product [Thelazia callipaeda]|uniref:FERM domain-containing protein 8 n=1 Tax=Thelazia callipaeda TaxID=103827 RepID=A0A0N5CLU8_THECL|nr:unnamed protein product [Thelazia callipaeda]
MHELKDWKKEEKDVNQKKLSESRCVNLPPIKLPLSKKFPNDDCVSEKKHVTLRNIEQIEDGIVDDALKFNSAPKVYAFANSPVGYTLSLALKIYLFSKVLCLSHLLDVNAPHDCLQQSTPISSRLDDSLDVTIYWADGRGFKFSLLGGKLATASSLLSLLSDHLGIDADVLKQVCALWMVSDLLEVQLKPHHNPYEIRKNWIQFLKRFTCVENDEAVADEPLLVLKRNVQLSVQRECELEEDYTNEILTEILYTSAKQEVLRGRYLCDIEMSIKLAALQMAIELESTENGNIIGDEVCMFIPLKYRHNVKTFHLFGIPIISCKGLETRILEEYQQIKRGFENKHAYRKAYLSIIRNTPFYGAAFFHGYIERPSVGLLKEIKKMILPVTLPLDNHIIVGINYEYITLIDETKQDVLLVEKIMDCEWCHFDDSFENTASTTVLSDFPYFLLVFPDNSFVTNRSMNVETDVLKIPEKIKILQVFSKQAVMIEALMNTMSKLLERNNDDDFCFKSEYDGQAVEVTNNKSSFIAEAVPKMCSSTSEGSNVTEILVNDCGFLQHHSDGLRSIHNENLNLPNLSVINGETRRASNRKTTIKCSSYPFAKSFEKLCLATLDADGRCLEAQGSLKVLLEVM